MMRTKIIIIMTFSALLYAESYAQLSSGVNDGNNYGFTTITTKEKVLDEIEGSPYLHEDFVPGVLKMEDMKPLRAFLRYNVANEVMEIKTGKNEEAVYQLPAGKKAVYEIGPHTFVYDQINYEGGIVGYFIEHYAGAKMRLLEKPSATFTEPVKATTGYGKDKPGKINIESTYYWVPENGAAQKISTKHRKIRKEFNSVEAQDYLKKNKIRSEEDLIRFIAYLDKQ